VCHRQQLRCDARRDHQRTYEWNHGLGEIMTAVVDAGLRVEFVLAAEQRDLVPLMYSLQATKPAG
jgi:hypothetical protein